MFGLQPPLKWQGRLQALLNAARFRSIGILILLRADRITVAILIASTPVATAPTCERIIRHEAGTDRNDCCQCSEGISKPGLFSCPACGSQQCKARSDPHPGTIFDDEPMEA
jgi:hypothetical protein